MTKTITSLLVGDHFCPPAKTILAHLPSGCQLRLECEDDNPYDEEAVRVHVDPMEIPQSQYPELEEALPASGATLEQVMSSGPIWLGYIPKTGGKPLAAAQIGDPSLVGNHEFREAMAGQAGPGAVTLGFASDGKARVICRFEEQA